MTEIQLYNTRTRRKEPFRPIDPANVRMYVCGPTVYDRAHIGNARPVVVFDVLFRLLRHVYGPDHVTYVRNFTDVDDKINARAQATGRPIRDITDETIGWYHEDMDALGALRPTAEPRATEHVPGMVAMIETLIARGHAYAADGHVLFEVATYPAYGRLSRRALDDMVAGARVEVAPYKKDPMDFVLWKPSEPGLPGWDSPWGRGRPGWHIECSAMSKALLGDTFDIHGGGIDLVFPHHENEVAQSCCANHTERMANVWMHNGFLQVEGEKMAKSLGNFFTVKDLLDRNITGSVIRFVLLSSHYRDPLDWTQRAVDDARLTLTRWGDVARNEPPGEVPEELINALAADLNTPNAITIIHKLARERQGREVRAATQFLGLGLIFEAAAHFAAAATMTSKASVRADVAASISAQSGVAMDQRHSDFTIDEAKLIDELLSTRRAARINKDFRRADAIRDGLSAAGVEIMDAPEGTAYRRKPDFDPAKLEALR